MYTAYYLYPNPLDISMQQWDTQLKQHMDKNH